jgi:thiol-disulfide isomerase/thioredoxin
MCRHPHGVWRRALVPLALALLVAHLSVSAMANTVVIDETTDYYEILDATRATTTSQLKASFRKMSLIHHPDKNRNDPSADAKFHLVHKAYQVLKDPQTRKLYDMHGLSWEDMKDYVEKHLKTVQQRLVQQRGQMFVRNVETKIEEPFLHERHVQVLHPSFAAKHLAGSNAVWVIFFGNPGCAPCRKLVPKLKYFAQNIKREDRKWLKVGAVNMAVHQNMELLRLFGEAAQSIPQLILLAPHNHSPGYGDFEVIPQAITRALNAGEISDMLLRASRALFQNQLTKLDQLPTPAEKAVGPVVALVSRPTRECHACADMLPVFRRIARRFRDSAISFRELDCATSPALCKDISSPNLLAWAADGENNNKRPADQPNAVQMPVFTESTSMHELYGYEVAQVAMDAQLRSTVAMLLLNLPVTQEPNVPAVLAVKNVPSDLSYLNQELMLLPERHQGRPAWISRGKEIVLRWLPGGFRSNARGAWLLSDDLNPVDQGWGYVEEDTYVPRAPMQGVWTLATRGAFRPQPDFAFVAKGGGHDEL